MSRYDGLIIPRSYSEYINKTDAATLSQALQLPGVMDAAPTAGSVKPVKSGGIKNAIDNAVQANEVKINCSIKGKIKLTKIGKLVIAQYYENDSGTFTPTTEQQWVPIATIPEGFRPKYGIYFSEEGSNGDIGKYQIYQNGDKILFYRYYNQTYGWETAFNIMWITD